MNVLFHLVEIPSIPQKVGQFGVESENFMCEKRGVLRHQKIVFQ